MAGPTLTRDRTQRVHWFAGRLGEVLDDLVGASGDAPLALGVLSESELTETVVELEARCEIGEVPALSPLRDAIFMPSAPAARGGAGDDPPEDTPLVSIAFASPKGEERLEGIVQEDRQDRIGLRDCIHA